MSAAEAVATSTGQIPFTGFSAVFHYSRQGKVSWREGILLALAALPAAQITAWFLGRFLPHLKQGTGGSIRLTDIVLVSAFCLGIGATAVFGLLKKENHSPLPEHSQASGVLAMIGWGSAFGALSALLGIGGGFLAVPLFMHRYRMEAVRAVATSMLAISITSSLTLIHYILQGQPFLILSLLSGLGGLTGSLVGTRLALKTTHRQLKQAFSVFQLVIIVLYPLWQWRHLF